jgi:hypothetical protein
MMIHTTGRTREKRIRGAARDWFLIIAIVSLSLLVLCYAVHRRFDHDEFAHIHSAWYVANGYTPYTDFFHNHHALLWYCLAPLLLVLGYSTQAVVMLGIAMLGLAMGIAFLTFLIARRATSSATAALLSVLLLLSVVMFVEKSVEIRPDVPQVLLGMVSVYFFVIFTETRVSKHMAFAGLCASFAFLFSQKTAFLLIAYAALLFHGVVTRRIPGKALLYFLGSLLLPLLLLLGYLVASGSFADYVLNNWLMNMLWLYTFSPLHFLGTSFLTQNTLFWLLSPVAIAFILLNRNTNEALRAIAFIGVVLLFSVLLVKVPHRQYFMFAIPLLCISIAYSLDLVLDRFRWSGVCTVLLVILLLVQPLSSLVRKITASNVRSEQLARVDFVIDGSTDSDLVYDGDIEFNLYRQDLHYFWFSVEKNRGLDTYNAIINNGYGDYDICQLVRSHQPKFISNYRLRLVRCGLRPFYDDTPFPGVYVRNDQLEDNHLLWRNLGDSVALIGYSTEPTDGQQGQLLHLALWWQCLAKMDTDYTLFIHVVGSGDRIWAQHDSLLVSDRRPTSAWRPGATVEQQYDVPLPADMPSGEYSVVVGMYYWRTGERLPVWDESGHRVTDDAIILLLSEAGG